ncbi:MAG: flagellar biosynthesis protein FlhB [Desulfovibrionaceae bacterium]
MAKDPSKTEKATPKQRNKARKDGNVPKGQELSKVATMVAGVYALRWLIGYYWDELRLIFTHFFRECASIELTPAAIQSLFMLSVKKIAVILLPFLLILAFVSFLSIRLQIGGLWTMKALKPKFKMFNLVAGLKRLFVSPQTFIRLGRSMLQAVAVGFAPYLVIRQEMENLLPLFHATADGIAVTLLSLGYKMCLYALIPMIIIAIADTWYTRWSYEENLKMTKDEIKDERKQAEGDPEIRQRQRAKMMESMAQRMMADVPKADVVVTNPTHIAVALRYNVMEAPAPRVLAKGANKHAERIKELAREHNIPIRENKPLAQALYKQVEIGEVIPEELYQAVAAILSRLNRFRNKYTETGA